MISLGILIFWFVSGVIKKYDIVSPPGKIDTASRNSHPKSKFSDPPQQIFSKIVTPHFGGGGACHVVLFKKTLVFADRKKS